MVQQLPERLGCSTISFQHLELAPALEAIASLGFTEIDLGALPGVCDHVPFDLDEAAIEAVAADVRASGLRVRSINGDIGDLNDPAADAFARRAHLERLLRLTAAVGAEALVLPCGALAHEPIRTEAEDLGLVGDWLREAGHAAADQGVALWVESLHFLRFGWNRARAEALHRLLTGSPVRPILDVAHVTAAGDDLQDVIRSWGDRIAHVHLRDAVLGDFSRPIGGGEVDFGAAIAALEAVGFTGGYALELPSRAYVDDATSGMSDDARAARIDAIRDAAARIAPELAAPAAR
ncbi:sugar phosphate isomerase/epimerase [Agrococcus terreus]|uniref:sugar phosphate isomerase/epimerase family protein n=1 Tax=Agrococcus terreus TaxID=574649 RepID=UPI00384FD3CA